MILSPHPHPRPLNPITPHLPALHPPAPPPTPAPCPPLCTHLQHKSKSSFILLNKADLLPPEIRLLWADYFDKVR